MRTLAILLMAASHVVRIIAHSGRGAWCRVVLDLDPTTQGLFMTLVGASLAWSWKSAQARGLGRGAWLRARARRAAEVYAVGVLIFFFEKGLQWPWTLVAPGILADIALAIIGLSVVASSRRPVLGALALAALGYGLLGFLEHQGLQITLPPLNAANAPLLPNVALAACGLAAGVALVRGDRRLLAGLGLAALGAATLAVSAHGFWPLLTDGLGRSTSIIRYWGDADGVSATWAMLRGQALPVGTVEYFNPTLAGQPLILGMVAATWLLLRGLRPLLARVERVALLPGRYSLGAYIFHLVLVSLPVVITGQSHPLRTPLTANLFLAAIYAAIWGYAVFRQWQVGRRRAAA